MHVLKEGSYNLRLMKQLNKYFHHLDIEDVAADAIPDPCVERLTRAFNYLLMASRVPNTVKRCWAANLICSKLNTSWASAKLVHRCAGVGCCPKGPDALRKDLAVAFSYLRDYTLSLPSLSRWNAFVSVCAFLGAMCMVHSVLVDAFLLAFNLPKIAKGMANDDAANSSPEIEDRRRLFRVASCLQDPEMLVRHLLIYFGNSFASHSLCWLLSVEAESPSCTSEAAEQAIFCRRHGFIDGSSQRLHADVEQDQTPERGHSLAKLIRGRVVADMLRAGSQILTSDRELSRSLWSVVGGKTHSNVEVLRRIVIPGLAQMWRRCHHRFVCTCPWRLFKTLDDACPEAANKNIVEELCNVPVCCLDPGWSAQLRAYVERSRERLEPSILCGGACKALMQGTLKISKVSIVTIEGKHARNRRWPAAQFC